MRITPTAGTVTIAKACSPARPYADGHRRAGEDLTYTITLSNTGGTAVTGYGVTDPLDANTTFVSAGQRRCECRGHRDLDRA